MNEIEVRKFIDIIHPDNDLFEIRVIDGKRTMSGYFTDSKDAYDAIQSVSSGNIYIVFNKIKPACYSRQQKDFLVPTPRSTTSDSDVTDYQWILIDIDPDRPSDCNSSDEELKEALKVASKLGTYLKFNGFSDPVFGMSGNGYHYLYKVNFANSAENQTYVKRFLQMLSILFSNDRVKIDTSVFSPAQLTKLLGTLSRKGTNLDAERPQRLSRVLHVPDVIVKNDLKLIQNIACQLPEPEKPTYQNNYGRDRMDIDSFISSSGLKVARDTSSGGVRKIILDECPFNSSHKAPDSALFVLPNGAVGFKCLHNSCAHLGWRDLRAMVHPESFAQRHSDVSRAIRPLPPKVSDESADTDEIKGSKFLQLHQIQNLDRSKIITIPTKLIGVDKRIIGLNKGETSLVSGSSGGGKSTIVNQICLNAVDAGFKASIWSGELTANRMKHWIHLQAAGKQHSSPSAFADNSFYVKASVGAKIDEWLKDRLYIYNNDYGNKFSQLLLDLEEHVKESSIDLVVLDNLMAMDILMLEGNSNQQQSKMIIELTNLAKRLQIHLILIAHPRKVVSFLRKNDISGSADLANAVDNVFIVHRVNNDFVRTAGEFFGNETAARYFSFDNVIEICKNRDCGIQDELFGFFFELESKRYLNERFESYQYGWTDAIEQKEIDIESYFDSFSRQLPQERENAFYAESSQVKGECPF